MAISTVAKQSKPKRKIDPSSHLQAKQSSILDSKGKGKGKDRGRGKRQEAKGKAEAEAEVSFSVRLVMCN